MEVTVDKTGPCVAKVTLTVPGDEFEQEVKKALQHVGRHMKMKGFRPGKVPAHVVERTHGESVRRDAREHFARQAYQKAVKENELRPIGFTRPNEANEHSKGEDFQYEFEISLRPEFELGEYKNLEVDSQLEPLLDEEVDSAIQELRNNQARPEPVGDEGMPEDGMALCRIEWHHGDEVILERDGLRLGAETELPGVDAEKIKEGLVGIKDGESFDITFVIPDEFEREDLRGQEGVCRVIAQQAFKLIEPTDEELAQMLETEVDSLKDEVKKRINEAKEQREEVRVVEEVLQRLIEAHPMDLPEPMVAQQTRARLSQLKQEIMGQGATEEQAEEHVKSQEDGARTQAERGMRALFLMQTIADKENLLVSEEEMKAELGTIAERNQASLEEVADYYQKNNLMEQMAVEILERKVRAFLRENTVVKEPR